MTDPRDMTGPELVSNWTRLHNRLSRLVNRAETQQGMIDFLRQRNEQLEAENARLKCPIEAANRLFKEQSE